MNNFDEKSSLHILHASAPLGPSSGGPFQSVRRLSLSQADLGHKVKVAMPWGLEAEAHRADWKHINVSIAGRILLPSIGWSPAFRRIVLACDADLLHTHSLWMHPSWVALDWKKIHRKPHVCSPRGTLESFAWNYKPWKKRPVWKLFEVRNLQSAALLHATSETEAESFRARGLNSPIAIIPNGVQVQNLEFQMTDFTLNDSFKTENRTALFLSRIHPKKGLPLLLDAWFKVKPAGWMLHIVGPDEGGHRATLERQVSLLGLADVVRFSGQLVGADKDQVFRDSHLFILPTHSENFGIAVAEALAHGLPVITTYGAPWALLESERCGWWVPVSADGIATALNDATRMSTEELAVMGERGRAVAVKRFGWERIAQSFIDCYRWLLGDGPKPECVE